MASLGAIPNLGSFFKHALLRRQKRDYSLIRTTEFGYHATDNPIPEKLGGQTFHLEVPFLVCGYPYFGNICSKYPYHDANSENQQQSLNSLADVVLQNMWALDVLTAELGGTCAMLNETCYFYINNTIYR